LTFYESLQQQYNGTATFMQLLLRRSLDAWTAKKAD